MTAYGAIVNHDVTTGEITTAAVTDSWIQANRSAQLLLTVDKTRISADGNAVARLEMQLTTPPSADGTTTALAQAGVVQLAINEELVKVHLDENGHGVLELASVETGTLVVFPHRLSGNQIEIEVKNV
jgi:hypothetical protein